MERKHLFFETREELLETAWQKNESDFKDRKEFQDRLNQLPPEFQSLVLNQYHLLTAAELCYKYVTQRPNEDVVDFQNRFLPLPWSLKHFVIIGHYSFQFAEDIYRLWKMNVVQRQAALISPAQEALFPAEERTFFLDTLLSAPWGIIALKEGYITPEEAAKKTLEELEKEVSGEVVDAKRFARIEAARPSDDESKKREQKLIQAAVDADLARDRELFEPQLRRYLFQQRRGFEQQVNELFDLTKRRKVAELKIDSLFSTQITFLNDQLNQIMISQRLLYEELHESDEFKKAYFMKLIDLYQFKIDKSFSIHYKFFEALVKSLAGRNNEFSEMMDFSLPLNLSKQLKLYVDSSTALMASQRQFPDAPQQTEKVALTSGAPTLSS